MFVRLGGCNLACSWCDTPHAVFFDTRKAALHREGKTYDPKVELTRADVQTVVDSIQSILGQQGGLVVFSGGEPMLQIQGILSVIAKATEKYRHNLSFAIETAGTIMPPDEAMLKGNWLHFTVSPKLANSNNPIDKRLNVDALRSLNYVHHADFKFVVSAFDTSREHIKHQLEEIRRIRELVGMPNSRIWLMPEGTDAETLIESGRVAAELACANGWNYTQRTHILTWGSERGH